MAELKRTLGAWSAGAFTFLNLVNTGIFFGVAIGAQAAGNGSVIAWVLLGLMSIYIAMCFSELTTMFPSAGGVYEFAKQAYGRFTSFQIGWTLWVMNNIAVALLVAAAMEFLVPASGVYGLSGTTVRVLTSIIVILLLNFIAYWGADSSAALMLGLSAFALVLLGLIIIPGAGSISWGEFIPLSWDIPLILAAAFLLSETFFGWESISFMAEEIKDPGRTIPKALNRTTAFVSLLSVASAVVTMGVIGVAKLASGEVGHPTAAMLDVLGMPGWVVIAANVGIVLTFFGNAAGSAVANPRLLMALARDKLFISQFADIHPKRQTPYRAIILQTIVAVIIVMLAAGRYEQLLAMVVAPSVILYALTLALVPWFRWTRKDQERPYRARFGSWLPLVPVLVYLGTLVIWAFVDPVTGSHAGNPAAIAQLRLLLGFTLASIPVYIVLTYFYDPDALIHTIDRFARLNLWFENVLVPKRVRKDVLSFLTDARGKRLLEFGAGVGTLTVHLAEQVGRDGKVYALDLSERNLRILRKRINKRGHTHVEIVHDPHLVSRVHPQVKDVDIIVSVGNLSYLQDVARTLKEMHRLLPERGRIFFVEYIDFFWFLPNNPSWLSNMERVREIFAEAGFAVQVRVKKGLFWNYLYIYGIKEKSGVPYI